MTTNHPITGLITREGFCNTMPTTSLLLQTDRQFQVESQSRTNLQNMHGGQEASRDHHCSTTASGSDIHCPGYQISPLYGQEGFMLRRTDYVGVASCHSQGIEQGYHGYHSEPYSDTESQFEQRLSAEVSCTSPHTYFGRELSNNSRFNYQSSRHRIRLQNLERQLIEVNQEPTDVNYFAAPFNAINPSLTLATDINPPVTPFEFLSPVEETQPGLEHSELVCGRFSLRLLHSVVLNNN